MVTEEPRALSRPRPVAARAAVLLVAAVAVAIFTASALRRARTLRATASYDPDIWLLPSAAALRVLSFGHVQMAADLVAARTNVYFGGQLASHAEQAMLARSLETAVDLDPRFHRLYLRGAAMLVYGGRGGLTIDGLLAADKLLARGAAQFPGDWELPFQRGFNLLYELPKLASADDVRAADWRQQGVEALRDATLLDGAPSWLPNLAARMLTRDGGEELAVRHLERTYEITDNPQTRTEIARKLAELRGRRSAQRLADDAAEFAAGVGARYPYAPEAFSLAIGPPVAPGIDVDALLHRQPSLGRPTGAPPPAAARTAAPAASGRPAAVTTP